MGVFADQDRRRQAEHLVAAPAEHALGGRIPLGYALFRVKSDDRHRRRRDEVCQSFADGLQFEVRAGQIAGELSDPSLAPQDAEQIGTENQGQGEPPSQHEVRPVIAVDPGELGRCRGAQHPAPSGNVQHLHVPQVSLYGVSIR